MSRILALSNLLLLSVVAGSAYGAQPLCPEGHVYRCIGGIMGVECWCSGPPTIDPEDLIWDIDGGSVDSISAGSEIVFSAQLPASSTCSIHFKLQIKDLSGKVLETREASLTASSPSNVLKRKPTENQYVRINATGEAHDCQIDEFLTFEGVVISMDKATGNPHKLDRFSPTFTLLDDEHSPRRKLPPILPPNRLPPGFFKRWNSR